MTGNYKKANIIFLTLATVLFGYYVYQISIISSANVGLMSAKAEFLAQKDGVNKLISEIGGEKDLESVLVQHNISMTEINNFDYIIIGPSEFASLKNVVQ